GLVEDDETHVLEVAGAPDEVVLDDLRGGADDPRFGPFSVPGLGRGLPRERGDAQVDEAVAEGGCVLLDEGLRRGEDQDASVGMALEEADGGEEGDEGLPEAGRQDQQRRGLRGDRGEADLVVSRLDGLRAEQGMEDEHGGSTHAGRKAPSGRRVNVRLPSYR